jgi:Rad3-related DNA helicase
MFNLEAIDNHFPIRKDGQASYREGQKNAIEFTLNAFNEGKRIVILEGPTGSGKSAIGMTIADMVNTSYYLTATKILQDQLVDEFGDQIVELKGRNAYPCTFYNRYGPKMVQLGIWKQGQLDNYLAKSPDCASGFCKTKTGKSQSKAQGAAAHKCLKCFTEKGPNGNGRPGGDLSILPPGMKYSACPYYEQVYKAVNGRKVVMNFSSFLFQTQMTKRFDNPRDMMILDETHNVEPQLMDFVSLAISDANLSKYGIFIPQLSSALEYAVFFQDAKVEEAIFKAIMEARENDQFWLEDELSRTLKKYKTFLDHVRETDAEWVAEYEQIASTGSHRVTLKPVYVHGMAHELLFHYAKQVVMMSATVLDVDVMCKSLGIQRDHVAAFRMKNRFPAENRPIYLKTVGKLTGGKDKMKEWGPALVVRGVMRSSRNMKGNEGLSTLTTFAIQELLKTNCEKEVKSRFLLQQNFRDKKAMLLAHANEMTLSSSPRRCMRASTCRTISLASRSFAKFHIPISLITNNLPVASRSIVNITSG